MIHRSTLSRWRLTKRADAISATFFSELSPVFRSGFRSAAPRPTAPPAQPTARRTTALWFCWPQTRAAPAPTLASSTAIAIATAIATAAAAALLSPPFPPTRCLLSKASASLLAPKKARLAAARHAQRRRKSGWFPRVRRSPPPSAPAVPCLQAAGCLPPRP